MTNRPSRLTLATLPTGRKSGVMTGLLAAGFGGSDLGAGDGRLAQPASSRAQHRIPMSVRMAALKTPAAQSSSRAGRRPRPNSMVVVSAPCPPQASRRGTCADVEPQARHDIKLEGQHPAALPWAAAPGSLHPGGKLDVMGGVAGIELVVPIKVPQVFGARIPNGAVKEKQVHSLVVPGDGKMMHLRPNAKPFPVEGGRGGR